MKTSQPEEYPYHHRMHGDVMLQTEIHPFGFSVSDNGRPSITVRLKNLARPGKYTAEELEGFMRDNDRRLRGIGFVPQWSGDPVQWMRDTNNQGCLWYWMPPKPCPIAAAVTKVPKVTLAALEDLPDHMLHQTEGIYEQVKETLLAAGYTED